MHYRKETHMKALTDELADALRTLRDPNNKWGSTEAVDSFIDEALAKYEACKALEGSDTAQMQTTAPIGGDFVPREEVEALKKSMQAWIDDSYERAEKAEANVEKLVVALKRISANRHINPDGTYNAAVEYVSHIAKEALQAFEKQGDL